MNSRLQVAILEQVDASPKYRHQQDTDLLLKASFF